MTPARSAGPPCEPRGYRAERRRAPTATTSSSTAVAGTVGAGPVAASDPVGASAGVGAAARTGAALTGAPATDSVRKLWLIRTVLVAGGSRSMRAAVGL